MRSWFTHRTTLNGVLGAAVRTRTARVGLAVLVLLVLLVASTAITFVNRGRAAGATPLHLWLHYDYLVGGS